MRYQVYDPAPALLPYVKCYWSLEAPAAEQASRDRIFPDGCMELVFHYGDLFRKYTAGKAGVIQPRSFVHGQLTQFMELEATGSAGIFSVRFRPGGVRPFMAVGLHEITGAYASTADLWGNDGRVLEDRVLHACDNLRRVKVVEDFLLRRLARVAVPPKAAHAIRVIAETNGMMDMERLARVCGVSRRHLERVVMPVVGVSPKVLARVVRFQYMLSMLERGGAGNLTSLALEGGFYDQAHFVRDFKEFTGFSPGQYFSKDLALAKYFAFGG